MIFFSWPNCILELLSTTNSVIFLHLRVAFSFLFYKDTIDLVKFVSYIMQYWFDVFEIILSTIVKYYYIVHDKYSFFIYIKIKRCERRKGINNILDIHPSYNCSNVSDLHCLDSTI
jgi:hypothetical protein